MTLNAFAEWQPRYAAHRVATFPVRADKTPAVKGYLNVGLSVSNQLALKFPEHNAFGFACRLNRITVLDVDTPDERVLADGLSRYGTTPFVVRSGSGNFQAWYRHNGERRRIRPDRDKPIDILGDGFVVAPPSLGSKGRYEIVQGTLDDLDRLPPMLSSVDARLAKLPREAISAGRIGEGNRNQTLWRHCMKATRGCATVEDLMKVAVTFNRNEFCEPLPDVEVLKVVSSAWAYERQGKNWFGYGARIVIDHAVIDSLAAEDPNAYALLSILRRHNWDRDFVLTKPFAKKLGWTLRAFQAARASLLTRKLIECINPGGRGKNDPATFRFPKGCENAPQ